ncbi:MAG: hypothetical protein E7535_01750 [Ruminococcaceae bacterium]|nr:hypothetical protein [Oscillospiraceae bacterium]
MEEALSLERLKQKVSQKYDYDEKRIVGIIFARYDLPLTQEIINSCYSYWHMNTGKTINIFWAGYGKYIHPDAENEDKIILKFAGNENNVYYDRSAFVSIKKEFNRIYKNAYQDRLQLILVNYYDGKLHFDESIKIDLEDNLDPNFATIRELMEFITNECEEKYDVVNLARKLKGERIKDYIKGITFSDLISTAIGIAGL